jgi:hypothetical protein
MLYGMNKKGSYAKGSYAEGFSFCLLPKASGEGFGSRVTIPH